MVRQNDTGPLTRPTTIAATASPGTRAGRCRPRMRKFLHGPHRLFPCSSTRQLGQNGSLQSAQFFSVATSSWLRQKPGRRRRKTLAFRRRRRSPSRGSSNGGGGGRSRSSKGRGLGGGGGSGGASGGDVVLCHGTVLPWPHSQKTSVLARLSGRPCFLPHCLQVNQIIALAPHRVTFGRAGSVSDRSCFRRLHHPSGRSHSRLASV